MTKNSKVILVDKLILKTFQRMKRKYGITYLRWAMEPNHAHEEDSDLYMVSQTIPRIDLYLETGQFHIGYGGCQFLSQKELGQVLMDSLRAAGLSPDWDGDPCKCVVVNAWKHNGNRLAESLVKPYKTKEIHHGR